MHHAPYSSTTSLPPTPGRAQPQPLRSLSSTRLPRTRATCTPTRSATFDPDTIRSRLRELAFLNSKATIHFRAVNVEGSKRRKDATVSSSPDGSGGGASNGGTAAESSSGSAVAEAAAVASRDGSSSSEAELPGWEVFHYSGGLAEYVAFLNRDKDAMHPPIVFSKTVGALGGGDAGTWGGLVQRQGQRSGVLNGSVGWIGGGG